MKRNDIKISLLLLLGVSFGCSGAQQVAEQAAQDIVVQAEEPVAKRTKLPKSILMKTPREPKMRGYRVMFDDYDADVNYPVDSEKIAPMDRVATTRKHYEEMKSGQIAPARVKNDTVRRYRTSVLEKENRSLGLTNERRRILNVEDEIRVLKQAQKAAREDKLRTLSQFALIDTKEERAAKEVQHLARFVGLVNKYGLKVGLSIEEMDAWMEYLWTNYEEQMGIVTEFIIEDLIKLGILDKQIRNENYWIQFNEIYEKKRAVLSPKIFQGYVQEILK